MPGRLISAAYGSSAKARRTTTLSQRGSFSKPSISTRASPAVTRGSPSPKRDPPASSGSELSLGSRTRHLNWRAGRSRSTATMRKRVRVLPSNCCDAGNTKLLLPRTRLFEHVLLARRSTCPGRSHRGSEGGFGKGYSDGAPRLRYVCPTMRSVAPAGRPCLYARRPAQGRMGGLMRARLIAGSCRSKFRLPESS